MCNIFFGNVVEKYRFPKIIAVKWLIFFGNVVKNIDFRYRLSGNGYWVYRSKCRLRHLLKSDVQ